MNENLTGKGFENIDKEEQRNKTGEPYPESSLSSLWYARREKTLENAVKKEFIEEYKDKIEKDKKEAFEKFAKQFINGEIENNDPDINSWLKDYKEFYDYNNEIIKLKLMNGKNKGEYENDSDDSKIIGNAIELDRKGKSKNDVVL